MNLRHIEDNPEQRSFLSKAISTQLKQIFAEAGNVVPDELVEYIVVLLAHGKPKEEVAQTLVDFLHDRAEPFSNWLFQYIPANWAHLSPNANQQDNNSISPENTDLETSKKESKDLGTKKDAGRRLRSAISIPEGDASHKRQGASGKRGRRQSPMELEDESEGSRGRRKSLRAAGVLNSQGGGSRDATSGLDRNPSKVRDHEPTRRLFANALGAVNAQFDRSFSRPKGLTGELGNDAPKSTPGDEQKKGGRGRSVFERLGKTAQSAGEQQGNRVVNLSKDLSSKEKQSVFERLQSRNNVMNMEVRMDLQTHDANYSQEPTGRSSTITFTVNHSTQAQKSQSVKSEDRINISNCHTTSRASDPPQAAGESEAKKWEVQQLREKVARMQSQVEELRVKSRELKPEESTLQRKTESSIQSVCVRNVHFMANKAVVAAHFSSCGSVCDVAFPLGPFGEPKGYCFVEFSSPQSVNQALQLSGTLLMGRVISVIRKRPQTFELSQQSSGFAYSPGNVSGRGFTGGRPTFSSSPWGIHGGGFGYGRASHQLIRTSSNSVQEASSTAVQPQLDSNALPDNEPSVAVSTPLDTDMGCMPVNTNGDLDFEIDTGAQDDDIRAVLDGEAN